MEMFASDEEVSKIGEMLAGQSGRPRLPLLVALAWHLRERDSARALALADEADALLRDGPLDDGAKRFQARLLLVRGEVRFLFAELAAADDLALAGMDTGRSINDPITTGDGYWLRAFIAHDRGDRSVVEVLLQDAAREYERAGDSARISAVLARGLVWKAFGDAAETTLRLDEAFPQGVAREPWIDSWVAAAKAHAAAFTNDPGNAIKFDIEAHRRASIFGQIRHAIICATNVADGFATLGDYDAALEWGERTLALARTKLWPSTIGGALRQAGDILRAMGRFEESREMLREALAVMEALPRSRMHIGVLEALGQLALAIGEHNEGLSWFSELDRRLGAQGDPDLRMRAWCGQAVALSKLDHPGQALEHAGRALALAADKGNAEGQIRALMVSAEIHRDHNLEIGIGPSGPANVLSFLLDARDIALAMVGGVVPLDLLNQLSMAYAASGDYKGAYESAQAATASRNEMRVAEAEKRAVAIRVRQEIERAQAEAEHHQRMAEALRETNTTLETLGTIGQEITASLDADAICETLYRHSDRLLDATAFYIYLLTVDGSALQMKFGMDGGQPAPLISVPLDREAAFAARCARERRELVVNEYAPGNESRRRIPGTVETRSMLFAPLEVGSRLMGVMTIQSSQWQAYNDRERSIFRTLCAYGAIALDNSLAYGAVELARQAAALQEQELRVAATAFESQEGMMIADAHRRILRINSAFTTITGHLPEEVVGQTPEMFHSTRHDAAFYQSIADGVRGSGSWRGEVWTQRKSGEDFPLWLTITAVKDGRGKVTHLVYSLLDITQRKMAEDEIRNLAFYDPLTNLPNRRLLVDRLRQALAKSLRDSCHGALLFVDLDNFKKLNDTRGHDVGDLLLTQVAARLSETLREGDTVARLGGDEFVVLIEGLSGEPLDAADRVEVIAEKVLETLNAVYFLGEQEEHSTPSIGVCLFKGQGTTVDDLLKQADLAMYQAKAAGRNTIRFFDPAMQAAVSAHAALEADLRTALAHNQFVLYYQPQVDAGGQVLGAEALLRWKHPARGMVAPGEFIPLAEETGLILPLGEWVLDEACRQLHEWSQHAETEHLALAVNISARQFNESAFVERVTAALTRWRVDAHRLKLELTESLFLRDAPGVIGRMHQLRSMGVAFSLDDFGTGYSSLAYLKLLPLSQIKIDQSFVRDIFVDSNDLAIVRAIVTLGQTMGLEVIAEGVETSEQREFLLDSGCDMLQGYLFGRPAPARQLLATRVAA